MQPRIRLFGSPKLEWNGSVTDLTLDRPTSLAYFLLLRADWVQRIELAYLYYPDSDESTGLSNLRKLIHRLKLQPWAVSLEADQTRLRLELPSDVADFHEAFKNKNFAWAVKLYGGVFLEGVNFPELIGFEAWLELERQDLARAWRVAVLEHSRSLDPNSIPESERLLMQVLRIDPLDEEAIQALLVVLTKNGERSRALEVYANFRQALRRELETEPLEATRQIIHNLTSKTAETPALGNKILHNLPVPTTRFVGRKHELEKFSAYLLNPDCRLLTVVGLGGMGKTRLTLEALRQHLELFQAGIWFVPLVGVDSIDLLIPSIATALNLSFSGSLDTKSQLRLYLHDKQILLFLDNFEQLKATGVLLEELLSELKGLKLVVTSRVVLELNSEWLFDVNGLSYPPTDTFEPAGFDAVQLFVGRAERLSSNFSADQQSLSAIATLCRQVQGMPLALELAVTWTRSIGVVELVTTLSQGFELFDLQHKDSFDRGRNLRVILNYSWELLTKPEQVVLSKLSVCQGGFTLEAATKIAGAHLGFLLRFINLALVRRNHDGRFDLHELVRQFAFGQMNEQEKDLALTASSHYFMRFLTDQGQKLRSEIQFNTLQLCKLELTNMLDSISYLVKSNQLNQLDDALLAFSSLIEMSGLFEIGIQKMTFILDNPETNSDFSGNLKALLGYFLVKIGKDEEARDNTFSSIEILESQFASNYLGIAYYTNGIIEHLSANYDQAILYYKKALQVFEQTNNTSELCRIYNRIAVVFCNQDLLDQSNQTFEIALKLAKEAADLSEMGIILNNYGINFEASGQTDRAIEMYSEALRICDQIGYLRGSGAALTNLGHVYERTKDFIKAKAFYEKSIEIKKLQNEPVAMSISMTNLADVLYQLGEHQTANRINLNTLVITLKSNALMYAARVIWSFTKYFALENKLQDVQHLASFLANTTECEQWVRDEASELLQRHPNIKPQQTNHTYPQIAAWLEQHPQFKN